jgi:hypothetical protein
MAVLTLVKNRLCWVGDLGHEESVVLHVRDTLHEEKTMWKFATPCSATICAGFIGLALLSGSTPAATAEPLSCLQGQTTKITKGFRISPVPLNLDGRNRDLVGLGSYIVNAQGGCNDCHTNPPFAEGGDPFEGEPKQINAAAYLAGGQEFGPFISRNITPCANERPAGLTFSRFVEAMRTGKDFKDDRLPPGNTPILQVMPWPIYGEMTGCDLRAIYEYLRAIPAHPGCVPPGASPGEDE